MKHLHVVGICNRETFIFMIKMKKQQHGNGYWFEKQQKQLEIQWNWPEF
jgi:hypothetical protein